MGPQLSQRSPPPAVAVDLVRDVLFLGKKAKYFGIGIVISRNSQSTNSSSLVPEFHFMLKRKGC